VMRERGFGYRRLGEGTSIAGVLEVSIEAQELHRSLRRSMVSAHDFAI